MNNPRQKKLIFLSVVSLLLLSTIVGIGLAVYQINKPDVANEVIQQVIEESDQTDFQNFSELNQYGMTSIQINYLKNAYLTYYLANDNPKEFKTVYLDPYTIREQRDGIIGFRSVIDNNEEHLARVSHFKNGLRLQLFDKEARVVFDSGLEGEELD